MLRDVSGGVVHRDLVVLPVRQVLGPWWDHASGRCTAESGEKSRDDEWDEHDVGWVVRLM